MTNRIWFKKASGVVELKISYHIVVILKSFLLD